MGSVLRDRDDFAVSGAASEDGLRRRGCTGSDRECEGECAVEWDRECGVFLRQGGRGAAGDGAESGGSQSGCSRGGPAEERVRRGAAGYDPGDRAREGGVCELRSGDAGEGCQGAGGVWV